MNRQPGQRAIVYQAKGDLGRANADTDKADRLELLALTKPSPPQ
jgi:hypothetical protein